MDRRQYVAALGTLVATGLAGCGDSEETPDGTDNETEAPTATPASEDPDDWQTTYHSALEEGDIQVEFIEANEGWMVVDYATETTEVGAFLRELETAATTYADVVAETWSVQGTQLWVIDPTIETPGEDAIASFVVRNEWALALQSGNMTTNEFMENVLGTAERYEPYRDRYGDATPTPTGTESGDGNTSPTTPTGEETPERTATDTDDGTATDSVE